MTRDDVLIVGAGPTGLVLALWLTKLGVRVRIVDKTAGPGTTSRALAVQARTLELYRQLDLDRAVIEHGHKIPGVNLWVRGQPTARMGFEVIGADITPYGFLEIFPQDEHERLLIAQLSSLGVSVQRNTELVAYADDGDGIVAQLRAGDGQVARCLAAYIAGCDGARSRVRDTMGTGFEGGTYQQMFYVADVDASGPAINGELHLDLDEADFLAVFPLAESGRARLIGTVRGERAERADTLQFNDVSAHAIEHLQVHVERVNWFSTYRVHHRVTSHFRKGRAFLVGDAAHIHSPVGGQGMNTGIGDAINLAWKLHAVLAQRAPDALLDSYEAERIGFARRLVATTDRVFTFVTAQGALARVMRTRVAPRLIPRLLRIERVRRFLFRTVSQVSINYRGGPLSEGRAGDVHGGDRLPWAKAGDADNFATLSALRWQAHLYGSRNDALQAWCDAHALPLHRFDWQPAHEHAGLARDAVYLLRPDTYVALAIANVAEAPRVIEAYFATRGIDPALNPARASATG